MERKYYIITVSEKGTPTPCTYRNSNKLIEFDTQEKAIEYGKKFKGNFAVLFREITSFELRFSNLERGT